MAAVVLGPFAPLDQAQDFFLWTQWWLYGLLLTALLGVAAIVHLHLDYRHWSVEQKRLTEREQQRVREDEEAEKAMEAASSYSSSSEDGSSPGSSPGRSSSAPPGDRPAWTALGGRTSYTAAPTGNFTVADLFALRTAMPSASTNRRQVGERIDVEIDIGEERLGMTICKAKLAIRSLEQEGAVAAYNRACPTERCLRVGDRFLEVNGVQVCNFEDFMAVYRKERVMKAAIWRPKRTMADAAMQTDDVPPGAAMSSGQTPGLMFVQSSFAQTSTETSTDTSEEPCDPCRAPLGSAASSTSALLSAEEKKDQ